MVISNTFCRNIFTHIFVILVIGGPKLAEIEMTSLRTFQLF